MRARSSTYRVQITRTSTCRRRPARRLPARPRGRLVYLSPLLAAEPGTDHGYDVVDPPRVDPSRGGAAGPGRPVGRGAPARAWACSSTSCRTTSASPRRREPLVVGRAHARPDSRTRSLRHRLGPAAAAADPGARRRRPPSRADRTCGSTASCATTTTASRSRRHRRRHRRGGPRPAALRAGQLAARDTTSTTAGSSP